MRKSHFGGGLLSKWAYAQSAALNRRCRGDLCSTPFGDDVLKHVFCRASPLDLFQAGCGMFVHRLFAYLSLASIAKFLTGRDSAVHTFAERVIIFRWKFLLLDVCLFF